MIDFPLIELNASLECPDCLHFIEVGELMADIGTHLVCQDCADEVESEELEVSE